MKSGLTVTVDRTAKMFAAVDHLATTRVMVGVPAEKTDRRSEGNNSITNAAIAYIMTNGAPEVNVPARPFLAPGVERVRTDVVAGLRRAGEQAFAGDLAGVDRTLNSIGLVASSSAKKVITEGIPPPLAESTIRRRILRRKSKKYRAEKRAAVAANLAAGLAAGAGLFIPLLDTSQLLKSIVYVIRKVR